MHLRAIVRLDRCARQEIEEFGESDGIDYEHTPVAKIWTTVRCKRLPESNTRYALDFLWDLDELSRLERDLRGLVTCTVEGRVRYDNRHHEARQGRWSVAVGSEASPIRMSERVSCPNDETGVPFEESLIAPGIAGAHHAELR
jgi:hypothetical protein